MIILASKYSYSDEIRTSNKILNLTIDALPSAKHAAIERAGVTVVVLSQTLSSHHLTSFVLLIWPVVQGVLDGNF